MKANETKNKENVYMIVAKCDPYHAKFHYHGERVLRRDGATPVEWVHNDNYGDGYTKEEALKLLERYADEKDSWMWYDDEWAVVETEVEEEDEDGNVTTKTVKAPFDGYEGEGWYTGHNYLVYRKGDTCLEDDVMYYCVEELIPADEEEE